MVFYHFLKNRRKFSNMTACKWHSIPPKFRFGYAKSVIKGWFMRSMPPHTPQLSYIVLQFSFCWDIQIEVSEVTREMQGAKKKNQSTW